MSAARGEVEPFLLLRRPEVPLRGVEARLSALVGPGGTVISAPAAPARHLGYVFIDEPSGTRMGQKMPFSTGTGLYPDPLLAGAAEVRPQRNLQFWVPVSVPRDAVAGVYKGEVSLTCRKEGWMPEQSGLPLRLPVELTVRGFALPEPSPLRNTAYFSTGQLPKERLSPEWLEGLYKDFAAHRHTPEPLLPSPRLRVLPGPTFPPGRAPRKRLSSDCTCLRFFCPFPAARTVPCRGFIFSGTTRLFAANAGLPFRCPASPAPLSVARTVRFQKVSAPCSAPT